MPLTKEQDDQAVEELEKALAGWLHRAHRSTLPLGILRSKSGPTRRGALQYLANCSQTSGLCSGHRLLMAKNTTPVGAFTGCNRGSIWKHFNLAIPLVVLPSRLPNSRHLYEPLIEAEEYHNRSR